MINGVRGKSLFTQNTYLSIEGNALQIPIAEEANLHVIKVKTIRSNSNNLIIAGWNFYMCATYSVQYGWQFRNACCIEGDDTSVIPQIHRDIEQKGLQTPFMSKCVGHAL